MIQVGSQILRQLLSRASKPSSQAVYGLEVSNSLWKRVNKFASSFPETSNQPERPSTVPFLNKLFNLGKTNYEKAVIGSLLIENGVKLPLLLEGKYLHSLVDAGLSPRAIRLWQSRKPQMTLERSMWSRLGVFLYCKCFRADYAEALVREEHVELDSEICLAFVRAYSELRNKPRLDHWIECLQTVNATARDYNTAIECMANASMWPQVQNCVKAMSRQGLKVDSSMLALCTASSADEVPLSLMATLLSEDGGLINVRRFREMLSRDPRTKLQNLLDAGKLSESVDLVLSNNSGLDVALAHQILRHFGTLTKDERSSKIDCVAPLFLKVSNTAHKDSHFVQFMLRYHLLRRDFDSFWTFASEYELLNASPIVSGRLSRSNYTLLWKVLHDNMQSRTDLLAQEAIQIPVKLRDFVVVTVSNAALTGELFKQILLCLNAIPDLPAMVCLLEFATTAYGLKINEDFICQLTERRSKSSIESKSLLEPCRRNLRNTFWRDQAERICSAHNTDFELMYEESKVLRNRLCF